MFTGWVGVVFHTTLHEDSMCDLEYRFPTTSSVRSRIPPATSETQMWPLQGDLVHWGEATLLRGLLSVNARCSFQYGKESIQLTGLCLFVHHLFWVRMVPLS